MSHLPPSHPRYVPPRKHWLERKGIIKVEENVPLSLSGWLIYGAVYAVILIPVYFLR